jgi:endo-1,4-beta-xylanase
MDSIINDIREEYRKLNMKMIKSNYKENINNFSAVILTALLVFTIVVFSSSSFAQNLYQTNVPQLKNVYANDFYIGCILSYRNIGFATDPPISGTTPVATPDGGYLVKFHMNSMSPGNNMKPQYTLNISGSAAAYTAATDSTVKDSINTHPLVSFNADLRAQLNWAQRQGFTFRGHTIVWHNQTPTQFFRTGYTSNGAYVSKDKMKIRLDSYIKSLISLLHASWPGMLSAVDVVNEAIDDGTGKVRTTGNEWYSVYGDSTYIMDAFQSARKYTVQYGESQIKLYYNDYNTEVSNKADGIVRLLTPIYQAGLLDGIGMQNHNSLSSPTAQSFITSYNKFAPICTEMAITELDVNTGSTTPSAAVLAQQANQYGMLFKCFVERSYKSGRGKIINVTKDGLNDAYTFVSGSTSLWDKNDTCKPAFYAAANVGINYNAIDSLVSIADTMHQSYYAANDWANLTRALNSASTAMSANYSVSVSADAALRNAMNNLSAAINTLIGSKYSRFAASKNSIDFGSVTSGIAKKDSVNISNHGTDTLKVTSILSTNASFTFSPATFIIAPSDSAYLFITFTTKDTSSVSGYIILTNNAASSPDSISVKGKINNTVSVNDKNEIPRQYALLQNYPNPFNPSTMINFELPKSGVISLKVYNILGVEVSTLINRNMNAGYHQIYFNASKLASGVYFYRLTAGDFVSVKKLMLLK